MSTVMIKDAEYEVLPMRAKQIAQFANVLGRLNLDSRKALKATAGDGNDFLWALLSVVTEDELVKIAAIVMGCEEKFAADNFDLLWVTEALAIQVEQTNIAGIIKNFTRLSSLTLS